MERKPEVEKLAKDLDLLVVTSDTTVDECQEKGGVQWTTSRNDDGSPSRNDKGQNLGDCLHKP